MREAFEEWAGVKDSYQRSQWIANALKSAIEARRKPGPTELHGSECVRNLNLVPKVAAPIVGMDDEGAARLCRALDPTHPHLDPKSSREPNQFSTKPKQHDIQIIVQGEGAFFVSPNPLLNQPRTVSGRVDLAKEIEELGAIVRAVDSYYRSVIHGG